MRTLGLGLASAVAVLTPGWLAGQVRAVPPAVADDARPVSVQGVSEPDDVEQTLDREAFVYLDDGRRDPFRPLLPGDSEDPRFEELRLMGLVLAPDSRQSVALVGVSRGEPSAPTSARQQTFRLREGAVLGDMTILWIEQEHVVVEVRRFGMREQLELHLHRQRGRDER